MNVLNNFRDLLLSVTENVFHYEAPKNAPIPHVIWQEVGGHYLHADNTNTESVYDVQLDVYTQNEFDPLIESLLGALKQDDIAFDFPTTEYDNELKLIRTIIECEVI